VKTDTGETSSSKAVFMNFEEGSVWTILRGS